MSRKPYVSTVVVSDKPPPKDTREVVQEHDGVRVGQVFENTRIGALVVRSIHRHKGDRHWMVRVQAADRHGEVMKLSELSDIVKGKIAYPHGCYTIGKGRIRRRKINRTAPPQRYVVLYARRPGGPLLKFVGRGKFARKGKPVRFRGGPEAQLAAWVLQDTFPVLRPYNLFWQ